MIKTIIEENIEEEIVEKKSKFIANIFYVDSSQKADEIIKKVSKKYHDARHNCYAYIINTNLEKVKRFSDDGEPSKTAGAPILSILEKNNISNVLVVVTRYFGGILLGTGGLVRAYSEATAKALQKATFAEEQCGMEILINIRYSDLEAFKYYCNKNSIIITEINYNNNVECKIEVTYEEKEKITSDNEKNNFKIIDMKILQEKNIRKNIEI